MAPNRKIFALKRIRLTGRDSEAAAGFMDEITLLKSLRGRSNIIQLIDAEVGVWHLDSEICKDEAADLVVGST